MRGGRGGGRGGAAAAAAAAAYYPPGAAAAPSYAAGHGGSGGGARPLPPPYPSVSAQAGAYAAYGLAPPPLSAPSSASAASYLPSQRPHEHYLVGPGRAQAEARFLSEGLQQQLQSNSYLVQAQVGEGEGKGACERC